MKITALIMAGGKGSRIGLDIEKPLLSFLGRPIIDWVVKAVESTKQVSQFYVITSPNTPNTESLCSETGLEIIQTEGKGYHYDLKQAILKAKLYHPVLTLSSDLPALTGKFLDRIIDVYNENKKPALTVLVPTERYEELGLETPSLRDYRGVEYVISGINIIDGQKIHEKQPEEVIVSKGIEAALNINTIEDLKTAERIIAERKIGDTKRSPP